jgi:hypothetical protein
MLPPLHHVTPIQSERCHRRRSVTASRARFLISLAVLLLMCACALPVGGLYPVRVSSRTITLAWDPPEGQFPTGTLAAYTYRLYYRPHGSTGWVFFGETPAGQSPAFILKYEDFGAGSYDFAVTTVNVVGTESKFHSSLDTLADPVGGWYLVWLKPY